MYSVLIIEDELSYRDVMETTLQLEGFTVHAAADAESGLSLLRSQMIDVILCDIMMSDMDGHQILRVIKADARLAAIPFVFVTALSGREEVRKGMADGADDYLTKPFSKDELLGVIMSRIRRHRELTSGENLGLKKKLASLIGRITKREREVLVLVGQGITSKDIANRLGVSLKTIDAHRTSLMKKLEVTNAAGLARWAVIAEQMQSPLTLADRP